MSRSPPTLVLGVDAGNSKTVALIATSAGEIVGAARGGSGDISNPQTGVEAALATIAATVEAALRGAGADPARLGARAFTMAGADWPEDVALLRRRLASYRWGHGALVVNDALGALRAGSPSGLGVASVCGTYATTAARAADGRSWYAGFWQDTGGGFALAHAAIRSALHSELGLAPPTALTEAALSFFGCDHIEEVLHQLTRREDPRPAHDLARFAPVVLDAAAAGDFAAAEIVHRAGEVLGAFALAAAHRVGLGASFPLVLVGGVFRHGSLLLRDAVETRVLRDAPGVRIEPGRLEPAFGALLLAIERQDGDAGPDLFERLAATAPPATLFAT